MRWWRLGLLSVGICSAIRACCSTFSMSARMLGKSVPYAMNLFIRKTLGVFSCVLVMKRLNKIVRSLSNWSLSLWSGIKVPQVSSSMSKNTTQYLAVNCQVCTKKFTLAQA